MPTDLATLLSMLKGRTVLAVVRSGSRLYGCAGPFSDEDFVAIVADGPRDLVRRPGVNVIVQTLDQFKTAIREHSILAFETLFCPPEHRLLDSKELVFAIRLDRGTLVAKAVETSNSDFAKAEKRWGDLTALKKLYHSIRVLMFARQILREGRISNYSEANSVWAAIQDHGSDDWEDFAEFVEQRNALLVEISSNTP